MGDGCQKSLSGKRNRNLHEIENNDLMCCQRCLVIARKYGAGQADGKGDQQVHQAVRNMQKKSRENSFRRKAIRMSKVLGLSTSRMMTITDFTKYCDKFNERIVIITDAKDRTTYDCAHHLDTSLRTHYLLSVVQPGVGGHYHYVINLEAYLCGFDNDRRKFYCHHCMKTVPFYKNK